MARPKLRETATIPQNLSWRKSDLDIIVKGKPEGVPLATFVKNAAIEKAQRVADAPEIEEPEEEVNEVPLLGYICAGSGADILPLMPGATVRAPADLKGELYCLVVSGTSMEAEFGTSITDGSYAFFQRSSQPDHGSIVHVEIEKRDGERQCFLKRFQPQLDGKNVKFLALNKNFKDISCKHGEYEIKGSFKRAIPNSQTVAPSKRSFRKEEAADVARGFDELLVAVDTVASMKKTQRGGEAPRRKKA